MLVGYGARFERTPLVLIDFTNLSFRFNNVTSQISLVSNLVSLLNTKPGRDGIKIKQPVSLIIQKLRQYFFIPPQLQGRSMINTGVLSIWRGYNELGL